MARVRPGLILLTRVGLVLSMSGALLVAPVSRAAAVGNSTSAGRPATATLGTAAVGTAAVGIATVRATAAAVTVSGNAGGESASVAVYDLGAHEDPAAYAVHEPVASVSAGADGSFIATASRFDSGRDRLYDKFVAVSQASSGPRILGEAHFVDSIGFPSAHQGPYPAARSKKGLQVQMSDDAELLGVQHAGINVTFEQFLRLGAGNDASKVTPFQSNGKTYYYDRAAVANLDSQIKPLSDNGILVNLILILYRSDDPNSAWPVLRHPDADVNAGTVFAFNTKTAAGVGYYTAAMEFLAERYTRPDGEHGKAAGFIVGNEVDAQWVWANSGDLPLSEFLTYYSRAVRIAWQATQKYWDNSRVYISMTHCWTTACGANPDPANPTRFYDGESLLDGLNQLTKATGDFPWSVAYHPYPQDLFNPAVWNDSKAEPRFDTPFITFKNIEVLPQYLQQPALTYGGRQRRIILSEQGCNTPNDSIEAQKLQAACYAYAYYKVRFLDGIDNFILHRHVDHQGEGGLRLGLWTWDPNRTSSAMPGQHKFGYDVFRYIDTARSLQVTDFAKSIIGIKDWADVIPGFNPTLLDQRPIPPQVGISVGTVPVDERTVSDFTSGVEGWRASDNATSVEATDDASAPGDAFLRVHFDANLPASSTDAKAWKGADVVLPGPAPLSKQSRLNLNVRVPAPAPGQFSPGTSFYAQIRAYGTGGRTVAYGVARLAPGAWNALSADLSSWAGREQVTRIKVWVRATDDVDWKGHFDLAAVSFSDEIESGDTFRNIDVSAKADRHSPKSGSIVTVTVTNNDVLPLPGHVVVRDCSGVALSPAKLDVTGLRTGQSRSFSATVTRWTPADARYPLLCIDYGDRTLPLVVTLPPPVETVLEGFELGAAGWAAGADVSSVATVGGFANGPTVPHGGGKVLEATTDPAPADQWKTVVWTPASPLDLASPGNFTVWLDAYGGVPGATGYEALVTLHNGASQKSQTFTVSPDSWTKLQIDISSWSGASAISTVEVGFRAVGTQFVWNPKFQLDDAGYFS